MAHPTPDALALIALGEDVESETLRHVAECRACFAEVEALEQVVSVGRSLGLEDRLTAPHPRVWAHVVDDLRRDPAAPLPASVALLGAPVTDHARASHDEVPVSWRRDDDAGRRQTSRRWPGLALAAALALVVGLTGGYVLKDRTAPSAEVSARTQLNALPRWPGANGTATVENGVDGQRTLVVTMQMPPTVSVDGTLEVWMSDSRAQDMVPMGSMTSDTARFAIPASLDVATHPIVDVSLEPRGDTDPAHSATSVVRGRLPA